MTAEKFLESKKLLRVVGGKPIMVVSVKNAIIALEIAKTEGMLSATILIGGKEGMEKILEQQLQSLKTKHSIS